MPVRSLRRVQNAALSTSLVLALTIGAAAPAIAADSRAPELLFAGEVTASGQTELDHIILVLDEIIDPTSLPAPSDFELLYDVLPETPASVELTYAGFAGPNGFFGAAGSSVLRLEFDAPLGLPLVPMQAHYTPGDDPLRDMALNEVAETTLAVETGELDPVSFLGATVDYSHGTDRILAVFSEALDLGFIPAASQFTVTVNGNLTAVTVATPITDVGIGLIDLVLPAPLVGSETVLVS